jgi:hypothetical protein
MTERPANTTGQLIRNSKGDCKISRTQGFEFISYVDRVGMFAAKHCLADRQRALPEPSRTSNVALGSKHAAEVTEAPRCKRVLGTEHLFTDCQCTLMERSCLTNVAPGLKQQAETSQAYRHSISLRLEGATGKHLKPEVDR